MRKGRAWLGLLLACACAQVQAGASSAMDDAFAAEEALRQEELQRRQAQQRQQDSSVPDVHTHNPSYRARQWVPGETPCFDVRHVELIGPSVHQFTWLQADTAPFSGHCLGAQSIEALRANLNDRLAQAGYITSHVSVPQQRLNAGQLTLRVHAGRVGQLKMAGGASVGDSTAWPLALRAGLALSSGALLNVRDLDQGSENIQRLGHDLKLFILPQELPDDADPVADIVAQWAFPSRSWRLDLGLDNGLSPVMGRTRLSAQMSWDNPLGLADQVYANLGSNLEAPSPRRRSLSNSLTYTIPWGAHRWTYVQAVGRSGQQIQGTTVSFLSTRYDVERQLSWKVMLYRDGQYKLAFDASYGVRTGRSHIEDVELVVQRRDATVRSVGLTLGWRGEFGRAQVNLSLARVAPRLRGDEGYFGLDVGQALSRRVTMDFTRQWTFGAYSGTYGVQIDALSTKHPTHLGDVISLGGRYTVRGFTGDHAVSASDGIVVRQELQFPARGDLIPGAGLQPYVAWDLGKVWGPSAPTVGRYASGFALGLRGGYQSWNWDLALSRAWAGHSIQQGPRWVPYISINRSI